MIITRALPAVMAAAAMVFAGCGGRAHSPASDTVVAAAAAAAPSTAPVTAPRQECEQAGGVWLPSVAEDGQDAKGMCGPPPGDALAVGRLHPVRQRRPRHDQQPIRGVGRQALNALTP